MKIFAFVNQPEPGMCQGFSETFFLFPFFHFFFFLFKSVEFLNLITLITGCDRICKITVSRTCSFSLTKSAALVTKNICGIVAHQLHTPPGAATKVKPYTLHPASTGP